MATVTAVDSAASDIPVDADHGTLRLTIVVAFLILLVISYMVIDRVIPSEGLNIIAIFAGFAITYLITQWAENWLKKRWPSGRTLQIDETGVRISVRGKVQVQINGQQQVNFLPWRFTVKKRTRVPKGWYVVACALEQDGTYLPVYTFMAPKQFETLKMRRHFEALVKQKDAGGQGAERDLRLAGQQRRLHIAEQARWMDGAEMNAADFESYLSRLQAMFPKWMPSD